MKFSPAGDVLWTAVYSDPNPNPDRPADLELDAAGNCFVTGSTYTQTGYQDYLTIKYGPNGEELWRANFNSTTNLSDPNRTGDEANRVLLDQAGNVYVTGNHGTLKYDPSGHPLWTNVNGGVFLALSTNDNTVLTVRYAPTREPRSDTLIKISSTGTQVWEAPLTNAAGLWVNAAGDIFCAARPGGEWGGNWGRIEIVKFDNDGQRVWTSLYDGGSGSAPHILAMDDAGNIYVAGVVYRSPTPLPGQEAKFDWLTLKYRPDGTLAWQATFNGAVDHEKIPLTLAVDCAGDVYVAGTVEWESWGGPREALLMKYDAFGNLLWTSRYRIRPYAINSYNRLALANNGTIVVAGESTYRTENGWRQEFLVTSFDQWSPRLTIGRTRETGVREVCLVSPRWSQFEIQSTTNLPATDWQSLGILTNLNGLVPLWDRDGDKHPMRFYRAHQTAP